MFMFYSVLINHFSFVTVTGTVTLIIGYLCTVRQYRFHHYQRQWCSLCYPFHCRVDIPQLYHSVSKRMEKSALSQTL